MARQSIGIGSLSRSAWTLVGNSLWATAAAADDYQWQVQIGDILVVTNLAASTPTYTIVRPENRFGRGADFTSGTVGQYVVKVHRFLDLDGWKQSADGMIYVDTTSDDLRFVVIRPPT